MPPLPASPLLHPNGGFQPPPVTLGGISTQQVLTPKPGTVTEQVPGSGCEATGLRGVGRQLLPQHSTQHPAPALTSGTQPLPGDQGEAAENPPARAPGES